jgi:hypothetical protein
MEVSGIEKQLIQKYLDTEDGEIIDYIIKHSWAFSVPMVQFAIAVKAGDLEKINGNS